MPAWSSFYADRTRSGGAIFDLHIHDGDFVRHCFGEPDSLVSGGSIDHVTTLYCFTSGPSHVVAEGGWDHAAGFPFRMRYAVVFEEATAEFDSRFDPLLTLSRDGRCEPVPLEATTGYDEQVRHFLAAIRDGATETAVTLDDALGVTKMLELEARSLGAR
jgi:predicted dehydrogenase